LDEKSRVYNFEKNCARTGQTGMHKGLGLTREVEGGEESSWTFGGERSLRRRLRGWEENSEVQAGGELTH